MIRKINSEDKELYMELSEEFYNSDAVLHTIPEAHRTNAFEEMMRSEEYVLGYIIESDGIPAGYALLSKTFSQEAGGKVIWIEEIYLRESFRGRGLGKEFFRFLFENCPASRYRLEAEPDNEGAMRLYRSLGFDPLPYTQFVRDI